MTAIGQFGVKFVKCFTRARFPIGFLNLTPEKAYIAAFLQHIENGGCFTHLSKHLKGQL